MKKYKVYLWCGCGYVLDCFATVADCEEAALYNVVAELVNNNKSDYFCETDDEYITEFLNEYDELEGYMYIDATLEGANRPVYLRTENMKIEKVA